ncbi:MAG: ATP-dependent zinc metalloprotease FtsH [Acidimicrobiales bacterium]
MAPVKKVLRSPLPYVALALAAVLAVGLVARSGDSTQQLRLDQFEQRVAAHQVRTAVIDDRNGNITGSLKTGARYKVSYVVDDAERVVAQLRAAPGVEVKVDHRKDPIWWSLLQTLLPVLLLIGAFVFVMNSMQGGGSRVMQFGKAKPKQVSKDEPKTTFDEVAGADEAVEELQEIKEFLEAPARFLSMGAKIPKGVLLYGPPGTGKTLLARAVAGEAGVPFFSISGSDFVEMFVGVGASRVRDLFEQAKANAPAIVFVDEIDAVGRHRGAGLGGGHDEREQTLNQLLVEMDGFDAKVGVILIAATNRPDILDPALLRPGRFDRQIVVDRPDLKGRRAILEVHSRGKPLAEGIDMEVLARRTPGFTGADLANLLNEAALLTARRGFEKIGMPQLEEAIDRVIAGPERRSRLISEKEKRVIAYHEGGHALVGHALPDADPIHKISIIARGKALGWTLALPTEDKYLVTRSALRDQLAMLMGGRTAEELIFQDPTTGAQNDIERATQIARAMVTEYGMSDVIGPQQLGHVGGEVFLGRDLGHQPNYSDEVAARIDSEVRRLIDEAHAEAMEILVAHRETLDELAEALVATETLDTPEVTALLAGVGTRPRREAAAVIGHLRPIDRP